MNQNSLGKWLVPGLGWAWNTLRFQKVRKFWQIRQDSCMAITWKGCQWPELEQCEQQQQKNNINPKNCIDYNTKDKMDILESYWINKWEKKMKSIPYKMIPSNNYRRNEGNRASGHHSNNFWKQPLVGWVGKSLAETGSLHVKIAPLKINTY